MFENLYEKKRKDGAPRTRESAGGASPEVLPAQLAAVDSGARSTNLQNSLSHSQTNKRGPQMQKRKNLNDDSTTMGAVHPSAMPPHTNESPPGAGPLNGHTDTGGVLRSPKPYLARTAYGPKLRIQQHFAADGRTKQSFKAECDINNIMARYLKTGVLEHVRQNVGQYLDVTGADFQAAQELVAGAHSMFHSLPSAIRTKFDNDPAEFLEFMENPRNAEEARELGLLPPLPEQATPLQGGVATTQPAASTQAPAVSPPGGDTATPPAKPGG